MSGLGCSASCIHPELKVGNTFLEFELPDQDGKSQKLSELIRGFPTVLIFSRGYYCPPEDRTGFG